MKSRLVLYAVGLAALAGGAVLPFVQDDPVVSETVETAPPADVEPWACPSGTLGRVTCSYVDVPEDYADPDISTVRLYIARFQPAGDPTGAPLAYLGGRLGEPGVADLGDWQDLSRATGREIVLVDLRGSGLSEPSLTCRELADVDWLGADLVGGTLDAARDERIAAVNACWKRLSGDRPIARYTLDALVSDVDVVRTRLGIDSWTLIAGGDATVVARLVAEQFAEHVESLVLLGATPQTGVRPEQPVAYASEALTAALGGDESARLDEIVGPLADRSIVFSVQAGDRTQQVVVSDETVHPTLARAIVDPALRAGAPALLDGLADEQWRSIAALRADLYPFDRGFALGTAAAVACAAPDSDELVPFWAADDFESDEYLGLADDILLDPALCGAWKVAPATRTALTAPAVPTLVVNGAFDLRAPASATAGISEAWPDATAVTIATGAPSVFDACVGDAVAAFVASPATTIEPTC